MLASVMEADRIAEFLRPFAGDAPLPAGLIGQLQAYLDLLLRWNARMNLTAVRNPEQIVIRHFGESLFAARVLRDAGAFTSPSPSPPTLADVGSGAGFPGLVIKLEAPEVNLTLIESHNKKATFLREVIRALAIPNCEVFCARAEIWNRTADVVTLRAVEKFDRALAVAAGLVAPRGMLCLLLGSSQEEAVRRIIGAQWQFGEPVTVPEGDDRVAIVGKRIEI